MQRRCANLVYEIFSLLGATLVFFATGHGSVYLPLITYGVFLVVRDAVRRQSLGYTPYHWVGAPYLLGLLPIFFIGGTDVIAASGAMVGILSGTLMTFSLFAHAVRAAHERSMNQTYITFEPSTKECDVLSQIAHRVSIVVMKLYLACYWGLATGVTATGIALARSHADSTTGIFALLGSLTAAVIIVRLAAGTVAARSALDVGAYNSRCIPDQVFLSAFAGDLGHLALMVVGYCGFSGALSAYAACRAAEYAVATNQTTIVRASLAWSTGLAAALLLGGASHTLLRFVGTSRRMDAE